MKSLIVIFLLLFISLLLLTFSIGVSKINPKPTIASTSPYLYNNKNISIENIHLTVFYFIPKDKIEDKIENWEESTEEHLKKLMEFHDIQFSGKSKITYDFFPEIIIGDKNTEDYELSADDENPDVLIPIKKEIEEKVFGENSTLNKIKPKNINADARKVYLIIFEGVGGVGNDDYSLISRNYLTNKIYKGHGTTFLAHEFYHTLGIPDNYQKSIFIHENNQEKIISILTKKDIMGFVDVSITSTYIERETLKNMGI